MLEIINNLKPFIENCYKELGVREYSRLMNMSPPTASKLLKGFEKEGLLKKRFERGYLLFRSNRESFILKELSKIYWRIKLEGIIKYLSEKINLSGIILFGSLIKLETTETSDVDLVIFSDSKKDINFEKYEKKIGRKIQLFRFKSYSKINSKELKMNILEGYILQGGLN